MNQIEMREVERQWRASERHQCILDRTAEAIGKRTQDRGRAQRHQQVEKTRRVFVVARKDMIEAAVLSGSTVPRVRVTVHIQDEIRMNAMTRTMPMRSNRWSRCFAGSSKDPAAP